MKPAKQMPVLVALLGLIANSAQSAITISNSEAASFVVSSNDLLQTAFSSVDSSALNDRANSAGDTGFLQGLDPNGEASLRDGVWQDEGTQGRGAAMVEHDEFAEYSLDLTASPGGYDITGIDLFSNWGTGQGRDEFRVSISFSLVATPTVFDQILTNSVGGSVFVYNPPTQTQGKMSITGIDATGIAGVRFDWPNGQENNGVGYSELDVFGNAVNAPPSLSSTAPISGATNVATVTELGLTFNEDVQPGTGTLELRRTGPDQLVESFVVTSSSQLLFSGTTLTITPSSPLLTGVEYYVVMASGVIEDLTGAAFAGVPAPPAAGAFTFTTDDTAPTLVAGELLLNKLPTSDLTIRFDEPVQAATGNITIFLAGDSNLVETINVPSGAVTANGNAIIVDIADLDFGESYFAQIDSGAITDLSGIAFAGVADSTTLVFSTVPTTLIHHWEFEGDATDSVGNHDGTLVSSAVITDGEIGQAVDIPAIGGRVSVDQSSLPETTLTLSCWINPTTLTAARGIAGTQRDDAGLYLRLEGGGVPTVRLKSAATNIVLAAGAPVTANEWTHLAYAVDPVNGLTLYVNGSPVASNPSGTNHTATDNFKIGNQPDVVGDNYLGRIDDVRIYASVLSDAEIAALAGAADTRPLILSVSQSSSDLSITWQSQVGRSYNVASSAILGAPDDPAWSGIPSLTGIVASAEVTTGVTAIAGADAAFYRVEEIPIVPLFFDDFESGQGGWTTNATPGAVTFWELGTPAYVGATNAVTITNAFSGASAWGTNLDDVYTVNDDPWLRSPPIDLTGIAAADLVFYHARDLEVDAGTPFDFGKVNILNTNMSPLASEVYETSGTDTTWRKVTVELPPAATGQVIVLEFVLESDNLQDVDNAGWYIDDVSVLAP